MFDGKGQRMGALMKTDSLEVKDDIVRGIEGLEDPLADGPRTFTDEPGSTSQGQEQKGDVAGEGVAKPMHAD